MAEKTSLWQDPVGRAIVISTELARRRTQARPQKAGPDRGVSPKPLARMGEEMGTRPVGATQAAEPEYEARREVGRVPDSKSPQSGG